MVSAAKDGVSSNGAVKPSKSKKKKKNVRALAFLFNASLFYACRICRRGFVAGIGKLARRMYSRGQKSPGHAKSFKGTNISKQ